VAARESATARDDGKTLSQGRLTRDAAGRGLEMLHHHHDYMQRPQNVTLNDNFDVLVDGMARCEWNRYNLVCACFADFLNSLKQRKSYVIYP
jgi:hypothetical protein